MIVYIISIKFFLKKYIIKIFQKTNNYLKKEIVIYKNYIIALNKNWFFFNIINISDIIFKLIYI